ncbi:MAG: protein-L-isoaspartate(D-aspartate) O-methyltransferase [Deltaproteobacteria bacterium]|nr:protein-L-isoaspartate(D-aspartate) O-methyltransferase [Deltaproteobacteria bacterium]
MKVFLILGFLLILSPSWAVTPGDPFASKRQQMVREQIEGRGVRDGRVLEVLRRVQRHLFVPASLRNSAYDDRPLPIGHDQTISQPYIVAYMTEAAKINPADRVLEIGTGSGYQAAVLGELAKEVYTIEILKPLAESSGSLLERLGYKNIKVRWGDGYQGWKEQAPFDVIIVTAAPSEIPGELVKQLKTGGRMVVPIGGFFQELYLITKTDSGIKKEALLPVRFVPMIHPAEKKK